VDITVSKDEKHEVSLQLFTLLGEVHKDVQNRRKEGRSCHHDFWQVSAVSVDNALDAIDFRLLKAPVERETVIDLSFAQKQRNATEAECWELLEVVIRLQHLADARNGLFVFVRLAVGVVQTLRIRHLTVGGCEVHSH